jgi:hypothetical protein
MSRRNFIPLLLAGVIVLDFAWLALWMDYNAYWGRVAQPGNVCHCGTPAVVNRTHRDISFAVSCPAVIAGYWALRRGLMPASTTPRWLTRLPLTILLAFNLAHVVCRVLTPC